MPKAKILAVESDGAKQALLAANPAGLPVDCIHGVIGTARSSDAATPCLTIIDAYNGRPDVAPFLVKLDVEANDLFSANTEWVDCTPVIIAGLSDYLIPGTPNSRALVGRAAEWNRDFV